MRTRSGFSMLEMLLALAILGGSLAILSAIVETGTSAAVESRALGEARLICQSKLSEVLLDASSGITPQSVQTAPVEAFDSASISPAVYTVEVLPAPLDGLLSVRVTVQIQSSDGQAVVGSYALTRWIVDPALGLEELEAEEEAMLSGETEALL